MNHSANSKKAAINTIVLNIRLVITMLLGLITTRIVLSALGEVNFGIYSLVAGVVGMLAFLQGAMTVASMRFLAYNLGTGSIEKQLRTFNTTLLLHYALGFILVIIIEIGGAIMFQHYLNIPPENTKEAKIVFHFMVLTTFIAIISVPFDAVINAHENMTFLAIMDIIGSILKLGAAITIAYIEINTLVLYGGIMFLIQLLLRIIKQLYTLRKYQECKVNFIRNTDRLLIKSILSFSSWNLLGSLSSMLVSQFRGVLLNMFFGVKLNSTQGIAQTVSNHTNTVSTSMSQAIRPQLIKSEGSGNRLKMLRLTNITTKYTVFLFASLAIPITIEISYLLNVWLTIVPDYTVIFCRLIILGLLIDKMSFEIGTAISAVGNIKTMVLIESSTRILSVFAAYLFFKFDYPPPILYVVFLFSNIIVFVERIFLGKKIIGLDIKNYFNISLIPVTIPIIITMLISMFIHISMNEGIIRFLVNFSFSLVALSVTFRFIGLNDEEYKTINSIFAFYVNKIKKGIHLKSNE